MKELWLQLAYAQVGSTAGKRKRENAIIAKLEELGYGQEADAAVDGAYCAKDIAIRKALCLCGRNHYDHCHWAVTIDNEHRAKFIIYFSISIDGKRHQVSFHSFDAELTKWVKSSTPTRWVGSTHKGKKEKGSFADSAEEVLFLLNKIG